MPYTVFRSRVSAAPAVIWAVILDDLSDQIGEDSCLEPILSGRRHSCCWERTEATPEDVSIQAFTADVKDMRITCTIAESACYEGTRVTQIVAPHWRDPDRCSTLSMSMTWLRLEPAGQVPDLRAQLRDDVTRLKRLAEDTIRREAPH